MLPGIVACDDDKIFTTGYDEMVVVGEINFEVSEVLPLAVGMDSTLVYTVGPENAEDPGIIFSSSNEKVATVDNDGTIHAIAIGEAVIQAVPHRLGFGATASVIVNVIPEVIKATQINITNTTEPNEDGNIYATDILQLQAEILPADHTYDRIVWGTSNPAIATVDENGMVTCVAPGNVKIIAAATDKSGVKGEFELEIKNFNTVEDIKFNSQLTDLTLPGYQIPLDYTLSPANATVGSVEWTSSDETVAVVDRGRVTARGFGSAIITATLKGNGKAVQTEVTVTTGKYYWGPENKWSGWICSNDQADENRGDFWRVFFPDAGTGKWRRDIKINCDNKSLFLWHSDYPVIVIKTNIPKGDNNTWDVRDAGMKDNAGYDLPDGNRLITWDATGKWQGEHGFNLFQLKVADIPNGNVDKDAAWYDVFWIRSFKSKEDAIKFAEEEIANANKARKRK